MTRDRLADIAALAPTLIALEKLHRDMPVAPVHSDNEYRVVYDSITQLLRARQREVVELARLSVRQDPRFEVPGSKYGLGRWLSIQRDRGNYAATFRAAEHAVAGRTGPLIAMSELGDEAWRKMFPRSTV